MDDLYGEMVKTYFVELLALNYLQENEALKATSVLKERTEKYGGAVMVICMERNCDEINKY